MDAQARKLADLQGIIAALRDAVAALLMAANSKGRLHDALTAARQITERAFLTAAAQRPDQIEAIGACQAAYKNELAIFLQAIDAGPGSDAGPG